MSGFIEIVEKWKVVDKWWQEPSITRHWVALREPGGAAAAVCYEEGRGWEIVPEPKPKVDDGSPTVVIKEEGEWPGE